MTEAPLFWLRQIETALASSQEIPLWGHSPPFPWEECSEQLAALLQVEDLHITHRYTQFLSPDQFTSGFGSHPVNTPVQLTPLQGTAHWLMSAEDVAKLTQLLLNPENSMKGFASLEFQEGFYRYVLLNCIEQIDGLQAFEGLAPCLGISQSLPQENALCIDINISHPKLTLWGRLVCSPSFQTHFKHHFSAHPLSFRSSPLAPSTVLSLPLSIGHVQMDLAQWESCQAGDLLILDRCTYDPKTHKGTATLMLESTPLFRIKIKENQLKILDYAVYYEEITPMDNSPSEDEEKIPFSEENHEASSEETENDFIEEQENPLWASHDNGEDVIEKLVTPHSVPLTLAVEIGRIQMPLDKLLQLQPGNVLELAVRPEEGVYLLLNGKKVAKGELIKLGDLLGIKILSTP